MFFFWYIPDQNGVIFSCTWLVISIQVHVVSLTIVIDPFTRVVKLESGGIVMSAQWFWKVVFFLKKKKSKFCKNLLDPIFIARRQVKCLRLFFKIPNVLLVHSLPPEDTIIRRKCNSNFLLLFFFSSSKTSNTAIPHDNQHYTTQHIIQQNINYNHLFHPNIP